MADEELIAKDLPDAISTIGDLNEKVQEISEHVDGLLKKVENGDIMTDKGVSFLEVKFHLLLSYLINLNYYMLLKVDGKPLQADPAVDRLVELRTVLEKLRPIDQKMKYQIDKLIKTATIGKSVADNDPLRFKPNPENMASKLEEQDADETEGQEVKTGVYVPPKVAAVPYDDDFDRSKNRRQKEEERARRKALNSSLLQELRDEYSEGPQEIREESSSNWKRKKQREQEEEKQRYEEDNLLRLPSKKRRKGTQGASSTLNDLTSFTDLSVLTRSGEDPTEVGDESFGKSRSSGRKSKSKWRRKSSGNAKKKGGLKRRRR